MYYISFDSDIDSVKIKFERGSCTRLFNTEEEAMTAAEQSAKIFDEQATHLTGLPGIWHRDATKILLSWGYHGMACWSVKEKPEWIYIESRNAQGMRVTHFFPSPADILMDRDSEEPSMANNEILLVIKDGYVIYSSLGRGDGQKVLRPADVAKWFDVFRLPADDAPTKQKRRK